uniref:Hexosyltransferase n=1 Tax=Astatotilapia calliptera TaxID=8154 RepID=A0AAX7UNE7_ASTCA
MIRAEVGLGYPGLGISPLFCSSTHPRTNNMTSAPEVKTETAAVAPHVSPGPYLVEYPYEYHFIINEPQKCEREKPFVVLMVPVAPNNRRDRDIIRSTWGNDRVVQGKVVTLFFLLGLETGPGAEQVQQQMLQESNKYHDLIQSNFVDCYKNLTIKTMVILEWLTAHCSGASYAMKIDSDMFLNVHNLVNMLLNAQKTNYMTGLVTGWGTVVRDPSSKWYVPSDIYAPAFYPVYALGLGYIMSLDLPKKLTEASRHVKALYIEDVYLGMLMHHLGISPTYPPSGDYFHVFPLAYNRCHFSRIVATTTHPFTNRVDIWKDLKKPGPC